MPPPRSKAQAGFLGLVASGKKKVAGLSATEAKNMMRGHKTKRLPARARKKR